VDDYEPRSLEEIDSLPLNDLRPADLASAIRHGGTRRLSVDLALKELTFRAVQVEREYNRQVEIGKMAVQLFKALADG
jgi:hypothetical protein